MPKPARMRNYQQPTVTGIDPARPDGVSGGAAVIQAAWPQDKPQPWPDKPVPWPGGGTPDGGQIPCPPPGKPARAARKLRALLIEAGSGTAPEPAFHAIEIRLQEVANYMPAALAAAAGPTHSALAQLDALI